MISCKTIMKQSKNSQLKYGIQRLGNGLPINKPYIIMELLLANILNMIVLHLAFVQKTLQIKHFKLKSGNIWNRVFYLMNISDILICWIPRNQNQIRKCFMIFYRKVQILGQKGIVDGLIILLTIYLLSIKEPSYSYIIH